MTIADEEITCIVGPSGCGKSTLLNLIAAFEKPTTGEIKVNGETVTRAGPERTVVFQQPSLFPWMTVAENVTFGPRKRGIPRRHYEADARYILSEVGLGKFENRYPYELSGGMRQRAQLARALVSRPQVLLMDEPFSALDWQTRLSMQELVLRLWDQNHATIVFITHDIEEAIFLGDQVHVMTAAPGRIKASIAIPFPKPRSIEIVTTPEFVAIKDRVLHLIRAEFTKGEYASKPSGEVMATAQ